MAAEELNRDVVAGRINFDTSKILPAFKVIDGGARKNAESFRVVNAELKVAERNYAALAKAMDKIALTSDERRKKILDESNALIAQRKAQTELLTAKKNMLDTTNQTLDAKLKAQEAIVTKRQQAIEQQEKEHQERMAALQQKTAAASNRESLTKSKMDRELTVIQSYHQRMQQQTERHNQLMVYSAEKHAEQMKRVTQVEQGVLGRSLQYMATGTLYYNTIQGATEAIRVISDFEDSVINLKRVMESGADIKFVEASMIQDAKDYGYALRDVGEVYVQIAQQGFNERETAALAKTALMAKNVESSFRDAEQAQQLLTGAILNYGLAAQDSERLLDRLNQVSNDYATDSNKLLQGINRVGAAAKNAGVPINELIGYLTVLNEAGFTGSVAGNAIKSFISFSSRDIAIDKLEKYVGTIKQASGEMMPFSELLEKISQKWYQVSDAERHEITQAVARGDQASRFIALMDNYDKVIRVAATAENSLGSAHRENTLAMTSLSKQTAQLKASWEGLMISIGESGFLAILKAIVHESKLLVDGFNSLPGPIRNTLIVTLSLGAGITALNAGMRLLTGQSLIAMVTGLVAATRSMFGLQVATNAANVAQKAFIATPIGATLTALAAVIGIVTIAWSRHNGTVNEASSAIDANQREVMTLSDRYKELKAIVDDNTKADQDIKTAKTELAGVIEKISALMPNLVSQWDQHGKAIDINIGKLEEWKLKYAESVRIVEKENITSLTKRKAELESEIELKKVAQANISKRDLSIWDSFTGNTIEKSRKKIADEILEMGSELDQVNQKLEVSRDTLDLIEGKKSTPTAIERNRGGRQMSDEELADQYRNRREAFSDRMNEFRHMVNVEADGYQDASAQLRQLQEIRSEFSDLDAADLYGIDEEIYRASKGIKAPAKGIKAPKEDVRKAFSFPLNDIDVQKITAEQLINDSQSLIDMFAAQEFSLSDSIGKTTEKVGLYAQHQEKLHEANNALRFSVDQLTGKQNMLNELYEAGSITAEEYNKASEDVQSRIKSITDSINKNSIAWWNDAKAMKDAKDQQLKDTFDFSDKWIAHQKAIGELSAQQEYDAWIRVQSRYMEGTEHRKRADEQVYAAKKALLQEEEKSLDELVKKQKDLFEEAKKHELQVIQERQDAFISAQDEKIRAVERLLEAEQRANEDKDAADKLAEKQARAKLLESAVGPEGKRERREVLKEIKELQEQQEREQRKRALEAQKKALQDEKAEKEKSFDQEKQTVESHYSSLIGALDSFKNDAEGRAEALKNIQIQKESEKNETILRNLELFVTQYRSKMASISLLSQSQQQIDLQRYNGNIDAWYAADKAGDEGTKARVHAENESLRNKYGISSDTGKLQHFADGGVVRGMKGSPVPIVAHAGEMFLNEGQQAQLFRLLNFRMPQISFAAPSFDMPRQTVQHIENHFSISSGDVNLHDDADIQTYFSERDILIRRMQSTAGVKAR
jgi:TP901 family phage tail tape measure protein